MTSDGKVLAVVEGGLKSHTADPIASGDATASLIGHGNSNSVPARLALLWLCALVAWAMPSATWAQQPKIDFLHLWRTQSEQRAVDVLRKGTMARGAEWREVSVSGFSGVKEEFAKRKAIDHTPNVVTWPLGRELNAMVANGLTRRITEELAFFEAQLAPDFLNLVANNNGLSGIPLGYHIQNHIVYNQDLLKKYTLERPKTWAELISYGPRLRADGIYLISNSDEPWQIRNMFMSIFSSLASAEDVRLLLAGDQPVDSLKNQISAAIAIFSDLRNSAEPGYHDRRWERSVQSVEQQRALAIPLGDYIIPEFKETTNLACDLAPGANYILWGADTLVFPLVRDAQLIAGQDLLVKLLADRSSLLEFARWKGSIPAIKNVPREGMRPCTAYMHSKWEADTPKVMADADSWNRRLAALGYVLSRIWNSKQIENDEAADRIVKVLNAVR